ncbi:MAG: integrase, partial [Pusillimonas sp.]
TATGLRLTDVRTITMPSNNMLRFQANKTAKPAYFDLTGSAVLSAIYARRKDANADHLMFLTTSDGKPVTSAMLRYRYDCARSEAAKKAEAQGNTELADMIKKMYLRDMRKRAADLAEDDDAASKLLQHSDQKLTKRHYRTKGTKLVAVR